MLCCSALPPQDRAALVKFARVQVDYAMGATGRSFIVGFGRNPPRRVSSELLRSNRRHGLRLAGN